MIIFVFAQKNATHCIGEQDKMLDRRITLGLLSLQRVAHQSKTKYNNSRFINILTILVKY